MYDARIEDKITEKQIEIFFDDAASLYNVQ